VLLPCRFGRHLWACIQHGAQRRINAGGACAYFVNVLAFTLVKGSLEMNEENIYLGDGVYASFDGYQIWLAVNHHENKQVALEPQVLAALMAYSAQLRSKEEDFD
jgi:hypothetical protein